MSHLLDTNSAIEHMRFGTASNVTVRMLAAQPKSVFLCSVVVAELQYGAEHGPPQYLQKNLTLIAKLRQSLPSIPFDDLAAEECGRIRAYLVAQGTPIGPFDLMIAAIAKVNQLTLVTHNTAEFSRVPGLNLEDWQ